MNHKENKKGQYHFLATTCLQVVEVALLQGVEDSILYVEV
jgi:hypothetical protein